MIETLQKKIDCILIDDDILVQLTWKMVAKSNGKTLLVFTKPSEFLDALPQMELDLATPIYIDSNLGDGVKGQDIAKLIYEKGFSTIYLATGFDPENFGPVPWIRGVVGKDPPWSVG